MADVKSRSLQFLLALLAALLTLSAAKAETRPRRLLPGCRHHRCPRRQIAPQCGKASTSKTPTKAMQEFCAETPNSDVIPLYVIGHETPMIYDWGCHGKEPVIKSQVFKVDAQGYPAELWQTVKP